MSSDDVMDREVRKALDTIGNELLRHAVQTEGKAKVIQQVRVLMHHRALSNGWVIVVDKDAMDSYQSVAKDKNLNSESIPFNEFYLIRYDSGKERVDSATFYTGNEDIPAGENLFVQNFRLLNSMTEKDFDHWKDESKAKELLEKVRADPDRLSYSHDAALADINMPHNIAERLWYMGYHDMCNERHFKKSVRSELPSKLAKKRLRKSDASFVGKFTVIKPVDSDYQEHEPQGGTKAAHWVRGHWKRCKTGVYWWKAHIAGSGQLKPKTGYKL